MLSYNDFTFYSIGSILNIQVGGGRIVGSKSFNSDCLHYVKNVHRYRDYVFLGIECIGLWGFIEVKRLAATSCRFYTEI